MDTIVKLIKNGSQKRASKLAKSIKEDIEKRNKLLNIANKSIAGWGTVEEYLSDDLASDSEDDRKIKVLKDEHFRNKTLGAQIKDRLQQLPNFQHPDQQIICFGMSNKETLFVNKTPAVLPHRPPKMIAGESQRDHQEEQEERVLLAEEMATVDNLVHSQEIIPDNEAETYEDKYFHSSHISSLNKPPGNCIKDSELESGEKVCIVKSSLENHLQIWHKIGANVSVIDVLEHGYKIPLITLPKAAKFPNNHSALSNANFVTQAIEELLNTGRIKEVKNPPYVVNPLSVSETVAINCD